jgi:hypothetical protein
MALSAIAVWGDLEASLFDSAIRGKEGLKTLKCPVMMTTSEERVVSVALTNSLDRPITYTVRAHISQGLVSLMREVNFKLPLAPGETQSLQWLVTPDDAAYGRVILVRVRHPGIYPLPSRDASCGIVVVDLPGLSGGQVFALALAASVLGLAGGLGLWAVASRPLNKKERDVLRAMGVSAVCVLAGVAVGFMGWWLVGLLMLVVNVLLVGAIVGFFVRK